MNIIIFAAVDFPAGSATTSRVRHIAKILTMAGNDVTVASLQANTKIPYPENVNTEGEYENIRYTYLSGNTVRPSRFIDALADTVKGCLGAGGLLIKRWLEKRVDVVLYYTPNFFVILPSLLFAKLFRVPTFLEMCEVYSVGYISGYKDRIKVRISALTESILPRVCSGIVVISTKIRERVLARGVDARRIFHLPILVDCRDFTKASEAAIPALAGKRYFLNSGGLGEKDGVAYLVEALALVCRQHKDIHLVFTGDSDDSRRQAIVGAAKAMGIEEQIVFTGFLSREQLIWAYQHAIALLCCRIAGSFANYGSPTKLSEYLSTGKPVITNEVGDNAIYLTGCRNAFIARVEDSESIAEQMLLILNEPLLADHVGAEGQKVAQKFFHYENYVTSLDAFLRVSSGGAGRPSEDRL